MKKLTIAEQIRRLAAQGLTTSEIADRFAIETNVTSRYVKRVLAQGEPAAATKQYTLEELSAMAQTLVENLYQIGAYAAHDVALELVDVLQRTPHAKIEQARGLKSKQARG